VSEPGHDAERRRGGAQVIPRPAQWETGSPAPWDGLAIPPRIDVEAVLDAVRRRPRTPPPPPADGARPSAVLVALVDGARGAEVILTRRSWTLSSHRGEVSFPGGRIDPGESAVQAALREAHEEVRLDPASVEVHGELTTLSTYVTRSYIVPIVGRITGGAAQLSPGTAEVDRVFRVPLVALLEPGVFHEERWASRPVEWPVVFFELEDETVWGATGRMLVDLLSVGLGV
jgi:8-oxo-dGTP pyrophosphatase MutT (NUDIX family)